MSVEVRLPNLLRAAVNGAATVDLEGESVGEILQVLVTSHAGLSGQVLTEDGSLHRFVNVYLNDDDVRYLDGLVTKVEAGDVITILPAVAGGAV